MEYRKLGRSGLDVSVIGLGGNMFGWGCDRAQSADVIAAARDAGINTIDTADIYGGPGVSEEYVGSAIRGQRESWVVMTKFAGRMGEGPNWSGASRGYIRRAIESSLRQLGTDYIDVYQVHWPDPDTPAEETMSALHDLVTAGKVRYIGCSNYAGWQIVESNSIARQHGWTPFVSSQPLYNVIDRRVEREHIPACQHYGLGVIPYSPLAGGFLTGKYERGEEFPEGTRMATMEWARGVLTDRNWDRLAELRAFADERGVTMTELAIGWLVAQPAVSTVIAGATRTEQVEENARAGEVSLNAEDLEQIDKITS